MQRSRRFIDLWVMSKCVHMHGSNIDVTHGCEMRASTLAGPIQLKAGGHRELHHAAACAQLTVLGV